MKAADATKQRSLNESEERVESLEAQITGFKFALPSTVKLDQSHKPSIIQYSKIDGIRYTILPPSNANAGVLMETEPRSISYNNRNFHERISLQEIKELGK